MPGAHLNTQSVTVSGTVQTPRERKALAQRVRQFGLQNSTGSDQPQGWKV